MPETEYGSLVKPLTFSNDGYGWYRQRTEMTGEFLGFDVSIEYGSYLAAGRMTGGPLEAHVHDFNQVMLWIGTDTKDIGELGAEVELCLGAEGERHVFTGPAAVFVPKGLPHFPATITKMDKQILFMTVSIAPESKSTTMTLEKLGELATWRESNHRDKVMHLPFVRKGAWHYGPLNRDDAGGAISDIYGVGFDFNMSYESINRAPYRFGPIPDKPHVHPYDEFLLFIGSDTNDLSVLGAEAEMCIGKEMERHIITTPTVVALPKGLPHCPLAVTKLDKPFIFAVVRPFGRGNENTARLP